MSEIIEIENLENNSNINNTGSNQNLYILLKTQIKQEIRDEKVIQELKDSTENNKNKIENLTKIFSQKIHNIEEESKKNYSKLVNIFQSQKSENEKKFNSLKEENKNQQKEINFLKEENKNQQKKINILKEESIKKEKEIKKIKEEIMSIQKWLEVNMYYIDKVTHNLRSINEIGSDILTKEKEYELLINRLANNDPSKLNNKIKFKIMYKATKDGDSSKIFHSKCDNKKNTLTMVKTTKGQKFGGYTEQMWNHIGDFKNDKNAFCFSFDLNKIYDNNTGEKAIIANNLYGPSFGWAVFGILDKALEKGGWTSCDQCYGYSGYEINNGERDFNIKEIEVYEIIFE